MAVANAAFHVGTVLQVAASRAVINAASANRPQGSQNPSPAMSSASSSRSTGPRRRARAGKSPSRASSPIPAIDTPSSRPQVKSVTFEDTAGRGMVCRACCPRRSFRLFRIRSLHELAGAVTYTQVHLLAFSVMSILGGLAIFLLEHHVSFADALYTAVSAVCVTGLITLDTATLSVASQVVIFVLIFLGGGVLWSVVPVLVRRFYFRRALRAEISRLALSPNAFQDILRQEIEYRALGWVRTIVLAQVFLWPLCVGTILGAYFSFSSPSNGLSMLSENNLNPWWFSFFLSFSAFGNAGFSLLPDNVMGLVESRVFMLLCCLLIVMGNVLNPIVNYGILSLARRWYKDPALALLRARPRKCFTHLFNSFTTKLLLLVVTMTTMGEFFLFLALEFREPFMENLSTPTRALVGFFQSVATRTAGFNSVDIAKLAPSVLLLYAMLMYLTAYPFALTVRRTKDMDDALADLSATQISDAARQWSREDDAPQPAANSLLEASVPAGASLPALSAKLAAAIAVAESRSGFAVTIGRAFEAETHRSVSIPAPPPTLVIPASQGTPNKHDDAPPRSRAMVDIAAAYNEYLEHDIAVEVPQSHVTLGRDIDSSLNTTSAAGSTTIQSLAQSHSRSPSVFGASDVESKHSDDVPSRPATSTPHTPSVVSSQQSSRAVSPVESEGQKSESEERRRPARFLLQGYPDPSRFFFRRASSMLSRDLFWLAIALFLITLAESSSIRDTQYPQYMSIFGVIFELCSAFGTVGLSLGFPGTVTSLSAQFGTFSKLVIIAVMIAGRHRGLPSAIDPAVYLPALTGIVGIQKSEEPRGTPTDGNIVGASAQPPKARSLTGLFEPLQRLPAQETPVVGALSIDASRSKPEGTERREQT